MTSEKELKEFGSGDFGFSEFRRNLAQGGLGKAQVEFENHFVVIFLHLQSSFDSIYLDLSSLFGILDSESYIDPGTF